MSQCHGRYAHACRAHRVIVHIVGLDRASGAFAPASELVSAPRELEQALLCARWRVTERSKFKSVRRIHVQEMKLAVKQLEIVIAQSSGGLCSVAGF